MLVTLLSPPSTSAASALTSLQHAVIAREEAWELRAVLLLWLALLLTVPFNLSALSSTPTSLLLYPVDLPAREKLFFRPASDLAQRVILLALPLLHRQGKEGTYAALVLARLFSRSDSDSGLPGFLDWAGAEIIEAEREGEANLVSSVLSFLSILPKMIATERLDVMRQFIDDVLLPHLRGSRTAASSGLVRKSAVKAKGRWWVARLGKSLRTLDYAEMPEHLEEQLDDLMSGLGDKVSPATSLISLTPQDTIVRYSSAKYLARLTCLLPTSLSEQVVLKTVSLLSGTDDEPIVMTSFGTIIDPGGGASGGAMGFGGHEASRGEARWHGVCLALAEMARRAVLDGDAISQAVGWVMKVSLHCDDDSSTRL